MSEVADVEVALEPSNVVGASRKGFELLKITEQTAALYKSIKWRKAEEFDPVEDAAAPDTSSIDSADELALDQKLEELERNVFKISDESDRSLFVDYMRTETELYLLFADWTEKQQRKLLDMNLRNGDIWAEALKHKQAAVRELEQLNAIFDLMKCWPTDGTYPQPPHPGAEKSKQAVRQLTLIGAVNQLNEEESYREMMVTLKRRKALGDELCQTITDAATSIARCTDEQLHFVHIVERLSRRWNVTKIPYEQQVFKGADINYPYRAELWLTFLNIPARYWGVELLEDTNLSLAPLLWEAADEAGYQPEFSKDEKGEPEDPAMLVDAEPLSADDTFNGMMAALEASPSAANAATTTENWHEKRVIRTFGHPFMLSPPVPVSSPFGPAPWCEIYAASKAEEESLPPEAFGEELSHLTSSDNNAPVNIVVRLSGDVGSAVKEERQLQVQLQLLKLVTHEEDEYTAQSECEESDDDTASEQPQLYRKTVPFDEFGSMAGIERAHLELEDFLMGVQRVCLERALFAILQSQSMRAIREMASPVVDDESVSATLNRLNASKTTKTEQLKGPGGSSLLILQPIILSPDLKLLFKVDSRPNIHEVPASWAVWSLTGPIKQGRESTLKYACAKTSVSVRTCQSSEVKLVMHDVPIMGNYKSIAATADLQVRLLFKRKGERPSRRASECSPAAAKLQRYLDWLGSMAVCYLRQQCLEVLNNESYLKTIFDLHHVTLPGLRTKHEGALLLNNLTKWIASHVAMSEARRSDFHHHTNM